MDRNVGKISPSLSIPPGKRAPLSLWGPLRQRSEWADRVTSTGSASASSFSFRFSSSKDLKHWSGSTSGLETLEQSAHVLQSPNTEKHVAIS